MHMQSRYPYEPSELNELAVLQQKFLGYLSDNNASDDGLSSSASVAVN